MGRVYPNKGQETELDEVAFDLADGETKEVRAGEENVIGEFTVPAQEVYRWGYGSPRDERNQGFAYADLRDDEDNPVQGEIWLVQTDAPGDNRQVVKRFSAATLRGDRADINTQKPLPEQGQNPFVGENSKLRLVFVPRNDETIDRENSDLGLPTTRAKAGEV